MAKRYYEYERLKEISGDYKIPGTLGRHYMEVIQMGNIVKVVGYDSYGGHKNVFVNQGETLGYDCGEVWVVPNPANIKDPLRRTMLELKIGKDRLHWVKDLSEVKVYGVDTQQREGCTPFFDGEDIGASSDFAIITKKFRFVRPIEQRIDWGEIYAVEGTDRSTLADFIREIWKEYPGKINKTFMVLESVLSGTYQEIK